jgi:aspartate/methionine/tyrosine aminotransferase
VNINPSNAANTVQEYYFSEKLKEIVEMKAKGIDVLNLGIGNPDLPPPQNVLKALSSEVLKTNVHGYQGYSGIYELRKAYSDWYFKYFNVYMDPQKNVLPVYGSKSGIIYISKAFLNKGDKVLIPNPGYPAYESAAKMEEATPIFYDLTKDNDWLPDLKKIKENDLSKVKIMWINYPHMPTGKKASRPFYEELTSFGIENNILICNDNPYNFILNTDYLSLLSVNNAFETALELNSLSKSHNLAGWRMGVIFAKKEIIDTINKIQSNITSGMFLPIQKAAVEALKCDEDWYRQINTVYMQRREKVRQFLDVLKCKYDTNLSGMFVWAEIPSNFKNGFELSDFLLYTFGIFVTPGEVFGTNGNTYIRVSLCIEETMLNTALQRIKSKSHLQNY